MKSILFTPGNVKAIYDSLKWQTRREIKPQPKGEFCRDDLFISGQALWASGDVRKAKYKPGDIVYVKEAFAIHEGSVQGSYAYSPGEEVKYPPHYLDKQGIKRCIDFKADYPKSGLKWMSPLFMPQCAARLFIKITNVRVEKLGDISEQDAIAEGIQKHEGGYKTNYRQPDAKSYLDGYEWTAQESYQTLWESINGPGSWNLNPWVFAYDFKRVETPKLLN